jgi:5'-nucleotidase
MTMSGQVKNHVGTDLAMNLLLSNDDGIYAEGLKALHANLGRRWSTIVVAPDRERSAISHAITLDTPIRSHKINWRNGDTAYAVSGTPADCIKLAMMELLTDRPDLMISGINPGANAGININYSGTLAAAREATLYGIPALAISIMAKQPRFYDQAAQFVAGLAETIVSQGLTAGTFLNVNVPDLPMDCIKGVRISRQNIKPLKEQMERRIDPRHRPYFWHAVLPGDMPVESDSDVAAISNDYISITPIKCDVTDYQSIQSLKDWDIRIP